MVGSVAAVLVSMAVDLALGWVLAEVWGIFAVPCLGLRPLPLVGAVGVLMLVRLITLRTAVSKHVHRMRPNKSGAYQSLVASLTTLVILPLAWAMAKFWAFALPH